MDGLVSRTVAGAAVAHGLSQRLVIGRSLVCRTSYHRNFWNRHSCSLKDVYENLCDPLFIQCHHQHFSFS